MLLIRYLQEHLHNDVEFANSLFRIVEAAFRTSCDRMGSYDCWKELIRNYQHNETFIKSSKHIKLLVTPLKVRLSGSEHLIYKRFEVWVFLLKALKENAIEVLDAYLGFCFGGTEGEQQGKSGKSVNTGLGKSCTVIWEEATEVMLEIMGEFWVFIGKILTLISLKDTGSCVRTLNVGNRKLDTSFIRLS